MNLMIDNALEDIAVLKRLIVRCVTLVTNVCDKQTGNKLDDETVGMMISDIENSCNRFVEYARKELY